MEVETKKSYEELAEEKSRGIPDAIRKINALDHDFHVRKQAATSPEERAIILQDQVEFYRALGMNEAKEEGHDARSL